MKAFVLFFLIACNSAPQTSEPLPPVTTDAQVPIANPPTRTAFHRNPYGDVLQADNLFVDGDFELTGRTDQAPWIVLNSSAQGTLNYDTGGRCRSGVRCGLIGVGDSLVGNMSSPKTDDIEIHIYIQPTTQRCADASVIAIDLAQSSQGGTITSLTSAPDTDGWCHFATKVTNMAYEQPAVYITLADGAKSTTLHVDQASALPASEVPVHGILPAPTAPNAIEMARANAAAAWIRSHRKFGRNVPRMNPR